MEESKGQAADASEVGPRRKEIEDLNQIMLVLSEHDSAARGRILDAVSTFFGYRGQVAPQRGATNMPPNGQKPYVAPGAPDLGGANPTVKEFISQKQPQQDIERIACLAYYSATFREEPHFKTADLSKLNTEAAQPKFSNAAQAVKNAARAGFIVPAGKGGLKQLSAGGEAFVDALPDRDAAKAAKEQIGKKRARRTKATGSRKKSND